MSMVTQITTTIEEIDKVCNKLWQCDEEAYKEFKKLCEGWMEVINQVIIDLSLWKEQNESIPLEIVFQQVKNLETALNNKDDFMLADTLKYEINNTLEYYLEMAQQYGRE